MGGGQLTALVGKLPDDVTGLQDNGASGILCAQVGGASWAPPYSLSFLYSSTTRRSSSSSMIDEETS